MKNRRQIARWLEKQEWYEAWIYNMNIQGYLDPQQMDEFIFGLNDEETIINSIVFRQTHEGQEFWDNVNQQFLDWYNDN